MPLWPYLLERPPRAEQLGVALETNWYFASPNSLGRGWPCELVQERLGVERLQVARAAGHEQEDHRRAPWPA